MFTTTGQSRNTDHNEKPAFPPENRQVEQTVGVHALSGIPDGSLFSGARVL